MNSIINPEGVGMKTDEERAWLAAWRYAGPELEKIRSRELRQLTAESGAPCPAKKSDERCGLEAFQQWMMRWRVRQMTQLEGVRHVG